MVKPLLYSDASHALRAAYAVAPSVIAWVAPTETQKSGWIVYDPKDPVPNTVPEILCLKTGTHPLGLNEDGQEVLDSIFQNAVSSR